jgi:hypothetical protein
MKKLFGVFLLIFFSLRANAQDVHGHALNKPLGAAGFTFVLESPSNVDAADVLLLSRKLQNLRAKFPRLIAKVIANSYDKIYLKNGPDVEAPNTLAMTVSNPNAIAIYSPFFVALKHNPVSQPLPYSLAEIALLHEFLHAYDRDVSIVFNNLKFLGWDIATAENASGYSFAFSTGLTLSNQRAPQTAMDKIKNDLAPRMEELGPWNIYYLARLRVQKFGYPSFYSIQGGPLETFAELGAYIALDPSAPSYIPQETIKWFQTYILK